MNQDKFEMHLNLVASQIEDARDGNDDAAQKLRGLIGAVVLSDNAPTYIYVQLAEKFLEVMREDLDVCRSIGIYFDDARKKMDEQK